MAVLWLCPQSTPSNAILPISGCQAGEKIHIQCRIKKVGKALGFCDCRVLSPDNGDTIATASHLKFMPMGMLWDFAAGWFFNTITWCVKGLRCGCPMCNVGACVCV